MTLNATLVKSTTVAGLAGLLFGFDTAVISGTTGALTRYYDLTPGALGLTVAIALLGTVIGSLGASLPGDRYGRRDSLRIMAVFYLVSSLGSAFASNWTVLLFSRLLGGLAIGGSSVLGPMYIAEIAPAKWRGRLVGVFQFNITLGILVAYFSNYLIGLQSLGDVEWRWKLGIAAAPALLFFVMLFLIPRSPRWLMEKGQTAEAGQILASIGEQDVEAELRDMAAAAKLERQFGQEKLFASKNLFPVFLAVSIAMFNQLSGINAILYYLNDIFARAGFSQISSDRQAVAIGATNLIFTVIAMTMIDRAGRRTLLIIGSVGTAACMAGVAAVFWTGRGEALLVWLLIGFIALFAFSQGAVIWVYLSEVFPTAVRAKGQSLGSATHWIMNALISLTYPSVAAHSKAAPFAFFAAMIVVQLVVVSTVYPETKGVTLEAMEKRLATGSLH